MRLRVLVAAGSVSAAAALAGCTPFSTAQEMGCEAPVAGYGGNEWHPAPVGWCELGPGSWPNTYEIDRCQTWLAKNTTGLNAGQIYRACLGR